MCIVLETRPRAVEHFNSRIETLREQNSIPGSNSPLNPYQNIAAVLSSGLRSLPDYFSNNQLSKVFVCFPSQRIIKGINPESFDMAEAYARVVQPGGMLYFVADNEEDALLFGRKIPKDGEESASLWKEVPEETWRADELVAVMIEETSKDKEPAVRRVGVWRRQEIYL